MRWSELGLEGSYPFDEKSLTAEERAIWRSLPGDLRRVLAETNGAEIEEQAIFPIPIVATYDDGRVVRGNNNWMTALWAFLPAKEEPRQEGPRSILHEHFGRHLGENFLPSGIYVFGECEQSCLVAVSTNEKDHGAIYYWEWYWQYPWYRAFFDARLDECRKRWPNRKEIDEDHADYQKLCDDFNYATLIELAPSFDEWVEKMELEKE
jgi:hypothetical protein